MPKSKRDKKISLTRTKRKGLQQKQTLVEEIRSSITKYGRIFTFSVENMRNVQLKEIRQEWKHSRFFFGKNKVMALALGQTVENEQESNLHKVSKQLRGQTGLLFTDKSKREVVRYFDEFRTPDYARSGNVASQTVVIEEGPIPTFSHSMEPQLRQLGMPTALKKGVIIILRDYTVCTKNEVLKPEQARILKLFGHVMAEFHVTIEGMWTKDGSWESLKERSESSVPRKVKVKAKAKQEEEMVMDPPEGHSDIEHDMEEDLEAGDG